MISYNENENNNEKIDPIISKLKHRLDLDTNIPTCTTSFSYIKYSMSRKDHIYI